MKADLEEMMTRMETKMDGRQAQMASLTSRIDASMVFSITDLNIDILVEV
jgi:hypothetical protein